MLFRSHKDKKLIFIYYNCVILKTCDLLHIMDKLSYILNRRLLILMEEWMIYSLMVFMKFKIADLCLTVITISLGTIFLCTCYYNLHLLEESFNLYTRRSYRFCMNPISYLLWRRVIIFIDMWLSIILILVLKYYFNDNFSACIACLLGITFMTISWHYYNRLKECLNVT